MTSARRHTILLVEDDPMIRSTTSRVLAKLGYEVRVAVDGLEAFEILEGHREAFDLVISDVFMPRLDGPALLQKIRKGGSSIPFVLVSGSTEREMLDMIPADAGAYMLPKPWTIPALSSVVRGAISPAAMSVEPS